MMAASTALPSRVGATVVISVLDLAHPPEHAFSLVNQCRALLLWDCPTPAEVWFAAPRECHAEDKLCFPEGDA